MPNYDQMIWVDNRNEEKYTDRYNGVDYVFSGNKGKKTASEKLMTLIPKAAAALFFGWRESYQNEEHRRQLKLEALSRRDKLHNVVRNPDGSINIEWLEDTAFEWLDNFDFYEAEMVKRDNKEDDIIVVEEEEGEG